MALEAGERFHENVQTPFKLEWGTVAPIRTAWALLGRAGRTLKGNLPTEGTWGGRAWEWEEAGEVKYDCIFGFAYFKHFNLSVFLYDSPVKVIFFDEQRSF